MSASVKKKDCGYSKSKMGKGSKFETRDRFCQTRGAKDRIQYGYPSKVVGEIEGVLGGEEKIRQEVIYKIAVPASPQRKFSKRCNAAVIPGASNAGWHLTLHGELMVVGGLMFGFWALRDWWR